MRRLIIVVLLLIPLYGVAQSQNWTYLLKGSSDSNKACYEVIELTIHDDQTFTSIRYGCGSKKQWKNYKNWEAAITNGNISSDGLYTVLTEFKNGFKTNNLWKIKITEKAVVYYENNVKGQLKRKARYKRSNS